MWSRADLVFTSRLDCLIQRFYCVCACFSREQAHSAFRRLIPCSERPFEICKVGLRVRSDYRVSWEERGKTRKWLSHVCRHVFISVLFACLEGWWNNRLVECTGLKDEGFLPAHWFDTEWNYDAVSAPHWGRSWGPVHPHMSVNL